MDHSNVQDMGQRPFPAMPQSAHHQRAQTEGARRPSLQLRLRSNSSAPSYSRPQDRDDLSPAKSSSDRRTPHSLLDRRSFSGGSLHTRGDSLDSFAPKAWMAKGSKFLKRQNSKQELTSLRTMDWVQEASEDARVQHLLYQSSPPRLTHSRVRSTGDRKFLWTVTCKSTADRFSKRRPTIEYIEALQLPPRHTHSSPPRSEVGNSGPQRSCFGILCSSSLTGISTRVERYKGQRHTARGLTAGCSVTRFTIAATRSPHHLAFKIRILRTGQPLRVNLS